MTYVPADSGPPLEPEAQPIGLCVPHIGESELRNLQTCLASNLLIHGPFLTSFERGIADCVGTSHAVATSSGTTALHIALLVAGVKPDDEVLLTTLTFIAPANAIRYVGAHPVFIGVEIETWQIDPLRLEEFVRTECRRTAQGLINRSTGRRVSTIIAVHTLGRPADMDAIVAIADRYGLTVIEDGAQALGVRYRGRCVGSMGRIGCFSFYGNKIITAAGGGMIVTHDQQIARRARYLINQAKDDPILTAHHEVGYNFRMTNVQAAIGCAQLERIASHIAAKRRIATIYADQLCDVPGITVPVERADAFWTFWLSTLVINDAEFGSTASQLIVRLRAQGIETMPLAQPLHLSAAHAGAQSYGCGPAERIVHDVVTLPSSVGLNQFDQLRVITAIKAAHRSTTSQSAFQQPCAAILPSH